MDYKILIMVLSGFGGLIVGCAISEIHIKYLQRREREPLLWKLLDKIYEHFNKGEIK